MTEARCELCAAFVRVREEAPHGKVGECALEVFKPPVRPGMTCSRFRPKGASGPLPKKRAAGEPRGRSSDYARPTAWNDRDARTSSDAFSRPRPLPTEIDIDMNADEFRRVLREVLSDELGISSPPLGARWQGGELVLRPGKEGTSEKRFPLEAFFHKIVMVRDKLRVLEAKVNAHEHLSDEDKVQLQAYITGCYGSLTSFNVLFAEKGDQFSGASRDH